jgi:predicted acyltransferase
MPTPPSATPVERLYFLDAFRGFTMLCMFGNGFGLRHFNQHPAIGAVAYQFTHAAWEGLTAWDLVMPFFLFVVGAVMPVSFAKRWAAGETWRTSFVHVLRRCALLVLFGLFARSIQAGKPVLDLINVLPHIAFAYLIAFLLLRRSWQTQAAAAVGFLAAHWAIFQFVTAPGVLGPYVKDANIGTYLDMLILGKNWPGSYATINGLCSVANVLAGLLAGRLMTSALSAARKMMILAASGVACIGLGFLLWRWIPVIKRLWTVSFAVSSIGYSLLALLLFYWLCEVKQWRRWAGVFLVVGSNSIFIYVFHESTGRYMHYIAKTFLAWMVPLWGPWGLLAESWAVILFEIYVCYWLYRRKIFFKL